MSMLFNTSVGALLSAALAAAGCSNAPAPGSRAINATSPAPAHHTSTGPTTSPGRTLVVGTVPPDSIVSLDPTVPREFTPPSEPQVMDQYGLAFNPDLLLVRVGQPVEFRSSEDVLHNVRVDDSFTNAAEFNVATPPFKAYTHVFRKAGYYDVSCDVHSTMRANIYVASSPYTVLSDGRGNFLINDVEPGSYKLTVLGGGRRIEQVVEIAGPRTELHP